MNIYKVYINDNYIDNEFESIVCYAKNEKNAKNIFISHNEKRKEEELTIEFLGINDNVVSESFIIGDFSYDQL